MKCCNCGKYILAPVAKPIGDMRIRLKDATIALGMLLEGTSIRAVERLTGLHRDTIDDLILTVGANCQNLLSSKIKSVEVEDVEADEIWSLVGMKEKTRVVRPYSALLQFQHQFSNSHRAAIGQNSLRCGSKCQLVYRHLDRKEPNATIVERLIESPLAVLGLH